MMKIDGKSPNTFLQFEIKLLSLAGRIDFSYKSGESTDGARDARVRKVRQKIKALDS
ncbi:MAG TPA: hypothetical protein VD835_02545 [Pyrinomonadaceae bacterium]|nr:hypothetical protein [Pyrinomonadaceae bacterium]